MGSGAGAGFGSLGRDGRPALVGTVGMQKNGFRAGLAQPPNVKDTRQLHMSYTPPRRTIYPRQGPIMRRELNRPKKGGLAKQRLAIFLAKPTSSRDSHHSPVEWLSSGAVTRGLR